MTERERVLYSSWDPNAEGVTHVVIQKELRPMYVFKTVGDPKKPRDVPVHGGTDMIVVPIDEALKRYDFQLGSITECDYV